MKHIATIPYDEVDFVWISDHYDIHLSGLCKMANTFFWFETIVNSYNVDVKCNIYMLSFWEEIIFKTRKLLFEQMVGFHWSYYPDVDKPLKGFYYRKPQWLHKRLFKLYYKIKKFI